MSKVKICGNTNPEDAKLAVTLGADYLGLIFADSKRRIDTAQAKLIMQAVPQFKSFVGVFVNAPKAEVEEIASNLKLHSLQFHGEETSLYCKHFSDLGYKVIKTFRIKDAMSLKRIHEYDVEAFLFDTFSKTQTGGTGKIFDWNLIQDQPFVHDKLFLAGGLNVDNLEVAIRKIRPYAVDVSSGVESSPGKKDHRKMKERLERLEAKR